MEKFVITWSHDGQAFYENATTHGTTNIKEAHLFDTYAQAEEVIVKGDWLLCTIIPVQVEQQSPQEA